jgi:hypothetical protein
MIENIDANFARLMKALDDKKLVQDTVVIFLTDNGPGGVRFNAGLRNRKGTAYEGGIRVPCYVRWPAQVKPGQIDIPLAHIDITPTLVEACGVALGDVKSGWDGRSFLQLLTGRPGNWPNRTLFFQWHRGDVPERYRAFAARGTRYKLVQAAGVQPNLKWEPRFELFDLQADPYEEKDLAAQMPDEVARLKREYEVWFADVTKRGFDPPRIVVGSEQENPVRLSRQDWRGPKAGWAADSLGHWEIKVDRGGTYRVTIRSAFPFTGFSGVVANHRLDVSGDMATDAALVVTTKVELKAGEGRVAIDIPGADRKTVRGPTYVELEYLGPAEKK